ncbi:MAG: hypothetical protein IPH59_06285 [bacterium]|nr:hypothetical protein [bacterium]
MAEFHFTPSWGDTGKTFQFQLTVIDEGGDSIRDHFFLLVSSVVPPVIEIAMNHSFLHSGIERVPVVKSGGELNTYSMQLAIAFGEGAIYFDSINTAQSMIDQGWKFLTFPMRSARFGELGLPVTIVNILGTKLLSESASLPNGKLFDLCFTASGDPRYDGYTDRIVFAWRNCRDNTIQSPNYDTAYLANEVESFDRWGSRKITTSSGIGSCGSSNSLGLGGPCPDCFNDSSRDQPIPQIIFRGGGIDRMCCQYFAVNSGDINLNGIPYEMADFELLADWLAYFDVDSSLSSTQLEQADANQDGEVATTADMVYLA